MKKPKHRYETWMICARRLRARKRRAKNDPNCIDCTSVRCDWKNIRVRVPVSKERS
jgi:hypothetical protein